MKPVLVTGAGGFIGSHLVEELAKLGAKVRAFVKYNSRNDWGMLELLPSDILREVEVISGDIQDPFFVKKAVKGCEVVFHLAALIGIPYSYMAPKSYLSVNAGGTLNVLEACLDENNIEKIVHTSTSETYGTAQYVPIDETHPVAGQSPYSATKIGADHLALSYHRSFGLPVKVVRPFNTYGPRQSARAIIPTIITQILNGQTSLRLGNLTPTRDLTFVKDMVYGFVAIAESDKLFGEITNIGMNDEISVGDLARVISELMKSDVKIISDDQRIRPDKSEVERLRCDNTKILKFTKWKPRYDLKRGLLETIEWLKSNINYYKSEIYNV